MKKTSQVIAIVISLVIGLVIGLLVTSNKTSDLSNFPPEFEVMAVAGNTEQTSFEGLSDVELLQMLLRTQIIHRAAVADYVSEHTTNTDILSYVDSVKADVEATAEFVRTDETISNLLENAQ